MIIPYILLLWQVVLTCLGLGVVIFIFQNPYDHPQYGSLIMIIFILLLLGHIGVITSLAWIKSSRRYDKLINKGGEIK